MKSGIYFIINTTNGKFYVGSASNLYQRWRMHKSFLNRNRHNNVYLQYAWNKYGKGNFIFAIVEIINNKNDLTKIEQLWINASNCCNRSIGYNLKPNAENSLGYKHTDEAKLKISLRNIKMGIKPPSPLGRKHTEETKLKMSLSAKGKPKSEQHKLNMKKPKNEQHKQKLSKAAKKRKLSNLTKSKISFSLLGNKRAIKTNRISL